MKSPHNKGIEFRNSYIDIASFVVWYFCCFPFCGLFVIITLCHNYATTSCNYQLERCPLLCHSTALECFTVKVPEFMESFTHNFPTVPPALITTMLSAWAAVEGSWETLTRVRPSLSRRCTSVSMIEASVSASSAEVDEGVEYQWKNKQGNKM